jgi:hypothetical protein
MTAFDERLGPLALIVGRWSGSGEGEYPTIAPFRFHEEVLLADGGEKPFLGYLQRTTSPDDGRALHTETGFIRWADGAPELVLSSPTGVTEVHQGVLTLVDGGLDLEFHAVTVGLTSTAKRVDSVSRFLHLRGGVIKYELHMAAVGEPHQLHLTGELHRTR